MSNKHFKHLKFFPYFADAEGILRADEQSCWYKNKNKIIIKSHTSKKVLNRPVKKWNGKFFIAVEDTAR